MTFQRHPVAIIKWQFKCEKEKLGGSRKYPYHTTDGLSEFRGQGGFSELEIRRHGGGLDLGFPQETDKSVFLEKAKFYGLLKSVRK